MKMIQVSPSVLAADFSQLGEEVLRMQQAGADMLHLDIMDGHFVPNLSFGIPVLQSLRKRTSLVFDTHLMITDPLRYVDAFVAAGADLLTFHVESDCDAKEVIRKIKSHGIRAGAVLKPATPAQAVAELVDQLDMVLIMTVEPGFGGQKFMADMLPKIREVRQMANEKNPNLDIEVDGGIDVHTAPLVAQNGANVLVAGSALFGKPDYTAAVQKLREAAQEAYCTSW